MLFCFISVNLKESQKDLKCKTGQEQNERGRERKQNKGDDAKVINNGENLEHRPSLPRLPSDAKCVARGNRNEKRRKRGM